MPFIIAVQTTEDREPHLVCFSQQPFTKQAMDDFIGRSLSLPLAVCSDGLGCFTAVQGTGIVHHRIVTGGGKKSTEIPQLVACNTILGNLKTALAGTYHAFKFAKYAGRFFGEVQPARSARSAARQPPHGRQTPLPSRHPGAPAWSTNGSAAAARSTGEAGALPPCWLARRQTASTASR